MNIVNCIISLLETSPKISSLTLSLQSTRKKYGSYELSDRNWQTFKIYYKLYLIEFILVSPKKVKIMQLFLSFHDTEDHR